MPNGWGWLVSEISDLLKEAKSKKEESGEVPEQMLREIDSKINELRAETITDEEDAEYSTALRKIENLRKNF